MEETGLKNFMHEAKQSIENFWSKLNITPSDIIQIVSCFGIGFLFGLFVRRYVKYFVILMLFAMLLLAILQHYAIIMINVEQTKELLGFSETATFDMIMRQIIIDVRNKAIFVGSMILGCLLGFKVG